MPTPRHLSNDARASAKAPQSTELPSTQDDQISIPELSPESHSAKWGAPATACVEFQRLRLPRSPTRYLTKPNSEELLTHDDGQNTHTRSNSLECHENTTM